MGIAAGYPELVKDVACVVTVIKSTHLTHPRCDGMVEAPKVYCKKEGDYVPIWWCLGSYMQQRYPCPEIETAKIDWKRNIAEVKCTGKEE